uniref:Un-named sa1614 n=1 Tax=Mastacembelus armatus TaxID=205130 RepID=A0A7N8XBM8_9TELE
GSSSGSALCGFFLRTMPECVSVSDFVQEVQEDWSSPTTSSFTSKMMSCRNTVYLLEEALDSDRLVLQKMKKAAKAKYTSGQDHVAHLEQYINSMEKLSVNCHSNGEPEVGSAFYRLADFSKELVSPMKNLVSRRHDTTEVKDKVCVCSKQVEKEKRELARQYGMVRTEVSGGEIAEELEKERRSFQLTMCEYLIKVNEIKTKRGVDLLQNLIKHYHSHNNFLQECVSTTHRLKQYMEEMNGVLTMVKQRQEEEKKQLCALRDQLRPDSVPKQVYNMHQLLGDKQYGTERAGFLYKKSDGYNHTSTNRLTLIHTMKCRSSLNLLTCQVKPSVEDKKCFDLISHNRTYHFLAEDEAECVAWISVLSNSKQEALSVALDGGRRGGGGGGESSMEDLTRAITDDIRRMPGNNNCCDCGAPDPGWLSTNLGILTCIECSGIHREMGVHVSRIQSLSLDSLGTSDLLLARNIGNSGFNEILEANLLSPSLKPSQHSHMAERKDFILSKYQDVHFVRRSHSSVAALRLGLQEATKSCDIYSLIHLYAQRTELSQPLHTHIQEKGETALHLAVLLADRTSLHILDFLAQNCSNVDAQTSAGNTALHYSCLHNKTDCVKLLLRARANIHIKNELGESALDMSRRLKHTQCEELLQQAQSNQFDHHVHVEYEWRLRHDDIYDSDDDFEDKVAVVTDSFLIYLSRPFSFTQSMSSSISPHSSGAAGGGLLSVGRRLAMAMELHGRPPGSAPSPPPPPPSSPAPPIPPRVKGVFYFYFYRVKRPLSDLFMSCAVMSCDDITHIKCKAFSERAILLLLLHSCMFYWLYLHVCIPRGTTSRRVQALYDCQADHHDELSFSEGQVLVVLGQEDSDWWHGYIEDEPDQRGLFPSSFVQPLSD